MKKFVSLLLSAVIIASMVPLAFSANAASTNTTALSDEASQETYEPEATEPETTAPVTEPETTQPVTEPVITPNAPKSFTVKETSSGYVIIKWDKVNNATDYVISRADEDANGKMGKYAVINTLNSSYTSYKNSANIIPGRVYKYKIVARRVSASGKTTTSSAKTVTTMTNPADVSKVKVSESTVNSITIKWSKSASATKYIIERSAENADGSFTAYKAIKTAKKTTTVLQNTGLNAGYIYKYRVKVQRTKSSITKQSSGKAVKAVTKLAAPKKVVNKKSTTTKIKIAWSKVDRAYAYEIYRKQSGTKYKKLKALKDTTYTDSNVTTGTTYKYKVRAYRKVSGKKYYGGFTAVKTSTAVSGVSGITVKSYLKRGLLSWKAVSGASGYDIFVKKANGTWLKKASTPYTNYLTGKLKLNKTYTYAVKSYKTVGGNKVYGSTKKANVNAVASAYGKTPSGTWVEVCLETQQMYMYVNNKLYVSTPVITGYAYNDRRTSPGYHTVISKKSPANLHGSYGGSSWNVTVSYWLGFTSDGQGIHDASWQPNFGGEYYKNSSRGSHGCVNTPTSAVAKIYSKAYVGMPVIVF